MTASFNSKMPSRLEVTRDPMSDPLKCPHPDRERGCAVTGDPIRTGVEVGAAVIRVNDQWKGDQAGVIIELDETRIRVMWHNSDGSNDKRTWVAKSAQDLRWRLAPVREVSHG